MAIIWNDDGKRLVPPAIREAIEAGETDGSVIVDDANGDLFYCPGDGGRFHVGQAEKPGDVGHIPQLVRIEPPPIELPPIVNDRLAALESSVQTLVSLVGDLVRQRQLPAESVPPAAAATVPQNPTVTPGA